MPKFKFINEFEAKIIISNTNYLKIFIIKGKVPDIGTETIHDNTRYLVIAVANKYVTLEPVNKTKSTESKGWKGFSDSAFHS